MLRSGKGCGASGSRDIHSPPVWGALVSGVGVDDSAACYELWGSERTGGTSQWTSYLSVTAGKRAHELEAWSIARMISERPFSLNVNVV